MNTNLKNIYQKNTIRKKTHEWLNDQLIREKRMAL